MRSLLLVLFFVSFAGLHSASAQVWSHSSLKWNENFEQQYSKWIKDSVSTEWLQQNNFVFSKWHVECAEFAYLTRLYFSYINHLEFAMVDDAAKKTKLSSLSTKWNHIASEQLRVQAFAREVIGKANTSTLPQDTVLIPLTKQFIQPGIIIAGDQKRDHTWVIKEINPSGIPKLIYATLPGSEYIYQSFVFPPAQSAFPQGKLPNEKNGGLRRFKWPEDLFKDAKSISYASSEQSDPAAVKFATFFEDIQNKIRVAPHDRDEEFGYLLDDLCMKVRIRTNIIIDAGQALKAASGRRFSVAEDDLYSTHKRDQDIRTAIQKVDDTFAMARSQISAKNFSRYQSISNPQWTTADECLVTWADNRTEPLGAIRKRFQSGLISSEAGDSFAKRWGEF